MPRRAILFVYFHGLFVSSIAISIDGSNQTTPSVVNARPCKEPSAPRNGSVMVWGNNMLIEYTCDTGLFPIGDVFGSCNPVRKAWSIRRPHCVSVECDKPDPPSNGKIYLTHNGSVITAECQSGYSLKGSRKRYCDGNNWSGIAPLCRDLYPASQDKREISEHENTTDKDVLFERQLQKDIIDADDTCYRRFSPPPDIEHGTQTVEYKYNTMRKQWIAIANYTCDDEYRLEDKYQRYRYCKGYKWIGSQNPTCIPDVAPSEPCKIQNGGCEQICVPFEKGRYYCDCETGFTRAPYPRKCIDIDECLLDNGGCEQTCNNLIGSYFCTCDVGYTSSGSSCYDVDECLDTYRHNCPGECINVPGSFICNCSIAGFKSSIDSEICEDVDECKQNNGGCEDTCINMYGSFKCRCYKKGFRLSADKRSCEDVDECKKYGKQRCLNGECINTPGSYHCMCNEGYRQSKNKRKCIDIDECKHDISGCQHSCTNTPGNYSCTCNNGFHLDLNEKTCSDIDECTTNNGDCEQSCVNTIGSYGCLCPEYLMVLSDDEHNCTSCDQLHYYDNSTGRCVKCMKHATIPGDINGTSPDRCVCTIGFTFDGTVCQDIDECNNESLTCEHECVNTAGSAHCSCNDGYLLVDDWKCSDIDECVENETICDQYCNNTLGSYSCYCEDGFSLGGDNYTCDDIDECYEQTLACDHTCVDFPGGAACECMEGFLLAYDNTTCIDIDECATEAHVCSDLCINTNGSYMCECSEPGMKLSWDKASCHDLNECMEGDNVCDDECINTLGSYRCSCSKRGFELQNDNTTCEDIDDCSKTDGKRCDQLCINTAGSYRCDCNPGFSLASFHTCSPCPRDYYRSSDNPECVACPAQSGTSDIAMTSISDCKCVTGYQGNITAGESCRTIPK